MPPHVMSLKMRLWIASILALLGSVALLSVSLKTLDSIKVKGPIYGEIINYKDLLADILPPPEYLIESYLVCFEILRSNEAEQAVLLKKLEKLEADFKERYDFWVKTLTHQAIRTALLEKAAQPGFKFFKILKSEYLPLIAAHNLVDAQKILDGPLSAAYREHREAVDTTVELANREVNVVEAKADSVLLSSHMTLLLSAAAINVLVLLLTYFSIRSIMRPMTQLVQYADRVSGGDYDSDCNIAQGNEIGNLAAVLTSTVGKVKDSLELAKRSELMAVSEAQQARIATAKALEAQDFAEQAKSQGILQAATSLERVVEVLGTATQRLAAQIEQSTKGAEAQAGRAAIVASSMEQMNATVLEVAQNATQSASTSANAQNQAQKGASVVQQMMLEIRQVQQTALALKDQMTDLGRQSEAIGQILNVISDIADQTNLLALNAAIEAARAGEAGRGFAVVADEVRKLAEKTMVATKQVDDAIRGVQSCAKGNIDNVEKAVHAINGATNLANISGDALATIVQLVGATSGQVQSIATAAEEQSSASEEIHRAVGEVNTVAHETSKAMEEAASAVKDLSHQTVNLRNLIQTLKSGAIKTQ